MSWLWCFSCGCSVVWLEGVWGFLGLGFAFVHVLCVAGIHDGYGVANRVSSFRVQKKGTIQKEKRKNGQKCALAGRSGRVFGTKAMAPAAMQKHSTFFVPRIEKSRTFAQT